MKKNAFFIILFTFLLVTNCKPRNVPTVYLTKDNTVIKIANGSNFYIKRVYIVDRNGSIIFESKMNIKSTIATITYTKATIHAEKDFYVEICEIIDGNCYTYNYYSTEIKNDSIQLHLLRGPLP